MSADSVDGGSEVDPAEADLIYHDDDEVPTGQAFLDTYCTPELLSGPD